MVTSALYATYAGAVAAGAVSGEAAGRSAAAVLGAYLLVRLAPRLRGVDAGGQGHHPASGWRSTTQRSD
jgi:hypothetical protein